MTSSQNKTSMPAIFVGHGNPMRAISDNRYRQQWKALGESLTKPKAILSISAHWTTPGSVMVTGISHPRTIHDFGGFPDRLYTQQYPAPGDPELADEICQMIQSVEIRLDDAWGLDHGTWTVLMHLFPQADIPVIQLSLDLNEGPQFHFDLGKELSLLRKKGVLIVGSGNITHNLSRLAPGALPADWAVSFDEQIKHGIDTRNNQALIENKKNNDLYRIAHPTDEHYLPLLYLLAQRSDGDALRYFNADFDLGTISMRSFIVSVD